MNIAKISFLISAVSLLSACDSVTQEELHESTPTTADAKVPLQLVSGIDASITRAHDSSWDNDDRIGVYATKAGSTYTIIPSGNNIEYKITEGGETWVGNENVYKLFEKVDNEIYLPADGSAIDVYAYYPYASGIAESNPRSITIPTNQNESSADADLRACDVLVAKTVSTEEHPVNIDNISARLLFRHVLSKVLIKVKLGTGVQLSDIQNKINSVILTNQPTVGSVTPLSQSLTISTEASTKKTISAKPVTSGDADYEAYESTGTIQTFRALLMPNNETTNPTGTSTDVAVNPHLITFTVGDENVTYHYPITYTLRSGYQTTFTITFGATGIKVDATIQPWTADGTTGLISPVDPEAEA